ncbi:unnamed protein product [Bursaphelenchus okinawaensis]|uniref:DRBM domain-containing protein n=1 Tax=Bursaphelenchus okinawaensis TaxID=465554 RepID=A0A811K831_9BILA|nr:unnamed protein product [Bursaphelenchus okinawaensis]CAG9095258.1 unnamed protein product [Bursaphelenchus okinawaensis]
MTQKPGQTLAALLEEGCRKYRNCQPQKNNFETADGKHGTELSIDGFKGSCVSRNRKTAQHLAARDVLLKIVKAGKYREFSIPGNTQGEAEQYILSLQPELGNDEQMANDNWPGKCDLLCGQKKINTKPKYDMEAIEEDKGLKFFKCTCTLKNIVVSETATSKKKAKAAAAKKMFDRINEEIKGVVELTIPEIETKASSPKAEEVKKPEAVLEGGFVNYLKKRLESYGNIKHITHNSCDGSISVFEEICSSARHDKQMTLHKIWPNLKYEYSLDTRGRGDQKIKVHNHNIAELEREIQQIPMMKDEVTVFLDVLGEEKCQSVFFGTGRNVSVARGLASCSALMFIKAYVDAHVKQL